MAAAMAARLPWQTRSRAAPRPAAFTASPSHSLSVPLTRRRGARSRSHAALGPVQATPTSRHNGASSRTIAARQNSTCNNRPSQVSNMNNPSRAPDIVMIGNHRTRKSRGLPMHLLLGSASKTQDFGFSYSCLKLTVKS